jgi:amidase
MCAQDLHAKAQRLIEARDAQFPSEYRYEPESPLPSNVSKLYQTSGFLSQRQVEIVSQDATSLAAALRDRAYTAVEVTEAFCRSAALAQRTTNCLAWFAPREALERATWLDQEMERSGKPVGPLHGVPISVKGESHPVP